MCFKKKTWVVCLKGGSNHIVGLYNGTVGYTMSFAFGATLYYNLNANLSAVTGLLAPVPLLLP